MKRWSAKMKRKSGESRGCCSQLECHCTMNTYMEGMEAELRWKKAEGKCPTIFFKESI